ncbi:MAG: YbjN domain-containing protein [Clostridia bacterium]|nr:YbjN domain-containing protein [Clostridia bacterium]
MDGVDMKEAQEVYTTVCETLDMKGWRYEKHPEDLVVTFTVNGEDIPMDFVVAVDGKRMLIRLLSRLPFKFAANKRVEGSIATNFANFKLGDGSFDYDLTDGAVTFRMTSSFRGSLISNTAVNYMFNCACATVDDYNDSFLMISKGMLSLKDFMLGKSEG